MGILTQSVRSTMPQLKAADLQYDPIVGPDVRQLIQQAQADVAAQKGPLSGGLQDRGGHRRGGRLAVAARDADDSRRTVFEEQFQFCREPGAERRATCSQGLFGRTAGFTTIKSASRKSSSRWPPR